VKKVKEKAATAILRRCFGLAGSLKAERKTWEMIDGSLFQDKGVKEEP
jgi:hypothetical protein